VKYLIVIGLMLLLPAASLGQSAGEGHVVVVQDTRIDTVLAQYERLRLMILENPDHKAIPGYRIQIFFDSGPNSSDRARSARDDFQLKFPEIPAYISWKAPNYRVRVGDYRNRLEAEKSLQQIMSIYPNAWVIKDDINFPQIN
jgi:hypothetical protein